MSQLLLTIRYLYRDREFIVFTLTLIPLIFYGVYRFLPFHTFAEGYSIVISASIFLLTWNARKLTSNNLFMLIGIGLLASAFLDVFHTFSYFGMGVFSISNSKNIPTQFWIAARSMQALTYLLTPLFFRKKHFVLFFVIFAVLYSIGSMVLIFQGLYPDCFILGEGLTSFKVYSEAGINLAVIISLYLFSRLKEEINPQCLSYLYLSLLALIASETIFMTYIDVYDIKNLAGHLFKIVSVFFVYKGVLQLSLVEPMSVIFRSLKLEQEKLGTQKKFLESELSQQVHYLNFYKQALDESSIVAVTDSKGVLEYVNNAFLKISKYDRKDLLGKNHNVLKSGFHDKDFFQNLWQTILNGKIWRGEIKNRSKDGDEYLVWTSIVPYKNKHNRIEKFISISQDITEIKIQREHVLKLQKLSAVGELSARILHDAMNPLSIIMNSSLLMRKYIEKQDYNNFDRVLENIDHSSHRIQDLFTSLRENLTRKQEDTVGDGPQKLSIHAVVASSIRFFLEDPRFSSCNIDIQNEVSKDDFILGRQYQLLQVFMNLLTNSHDAIVESPTKWIKIRSEVKGLSVVVTFCDSGPRVSKEISDKMFDSFYTTKGERNGTGLGLGICRDILHKMKGRIELNQRSENMEFIITLPLCIEGS